MTCPCGTRLSAPASIESGLCGRCRQRRVPAAPRALYPGDWLEADDVAIGFVWDVRGDEIEVRSYNNEPPSVRFMSRAQACAYEIVPNETYGTERPPYVETEDR